MDPTNLRNTRPRDLDRYIERFLLPDTAFRREVRRAIDKIASFLKERCFQDTGKLVRVTKVVKGGSSGKGTALRGRSDADLVVFLSNLRSYQDQIDRRGEFIKEIKRRLEEWEHEQGWRFKVKFEVSKWDNPRVLSFTMKSENISQEVEFDVLPAFDVLGQVTPNFKPNPQVYINLISESWNGGEFSTCFTELQKRFLKQRCTKLKNLIRLVKCWYRMCKEKMTKLPPQYALELLTVYAWEHGSQQTYFNTAQGFRTVLYLIEGYQELLVFWTINYDFQNENIRRYLWSKLKEPRPVILDPADPTCDLGTGCWDKLAEEAQSWSSAPCFKNQDGSWVKPWHVPLEQTEKGRRDFHLSRDHTSLEEAYFFDEPTEIETNYYYLESGGRIGQWGRLAQERHHLSSSAPYFQKQGGCWVEPRDVWVEQTYNGRTGFHLPSDSETEDSLKWASVSCDHHSPPAAQKESYCTIL